MTDTLREAVEREMRERALRHHLEESPGYRMECVNLGAAVEVAVRMIERERSNGPEPPYPYFWRTQIQRAKEKAHRLMGELRRQAAKSSGWKQRFKSTRGTVPVMAKRIAALDKALAEQRERWGHVERCFCHAEAEIDNSTTCIMKHKHPHRDDRCAPQPEGGKHGE